MQSIATEHLCSVAIDCWALMLSSYWLHERRLGGRVYLPPVADLTRWRKRGRNTVTHHNRKGMLLLLEKNIWRSHILTDTKAHLYRTYILPVLLYGCESWTVSKTLAKRLDAFDTWCLRKILRIPYTRHNTSDTVRSITGCSPVSEKVKSFRLRFFGHLARSAPEEDHHHVIAAALRPAPDWRRPPGRPRSTWLRVIVEDVQPQNSGVHMAWRKAKVRDTWHQVVSTATLC